MKCLSLKEIPLHDPYVLASKHDKIYYLYNSAGPRHRSSINESKHEFDRFGVKVYTSRNLHQWEGPHLVFSIPDDTWAHPLHGAWAPEVHQYKGKYYLFVTLHNRDKVISQPPDSWRINHWRGTTIAMSDSLHGPFELLRTDAPFTPDNFMTLDGTLFVDEMQQPWMVYCHEWIQVIDGTIEAIHLTSDLKGSIGEPIHLFKGSDAPWLNQERVPARKEYLYVTDGPQLYRTYTGELLMLWSSYNKDGYVQTMARSHSKTLLGPWKQLKPLVYADSGHGMLFNTFSGELMLILHSPFAMPKSRAHIYQLQDKGDNLEVICERTDLY